MRLKAVIAQYVAFRKSLGAHFKRAEGTLNAFCRYLGEEINVADVQAEQVQTFLTGTGPITRNWQSKHGALNGLYRYAISRGLVGASPLPATTPSLPERSLLIFTRLTNCADSSTPLLRRARKDFASLSRIRCERF